MDPQGDDRAAPKASGRRIWVAWSLLLIASLLIVVPMVGQVLITVVPIMFQATGGIFVLLELETSGWFLALVLGAFAIALHRHVSERALLVTNSMTLLASVMYFGDVAVTTPHSCSMGALAWMIAVPPFSFQMLILLPLTIIVTRRAASWGSKLALVHTLVLGVAANLGVAVVCLVAFGTLL